MALTFLKPPALQAGDLVATVSLSWGGAGMLRARYEFGKRQLETRFGLRVVEMPHTLADADYLYKNPKARADDLMQAFADPSIKGIFSCIGGSDSVRLLPFVDLEIIHQNPKVFMGYSDTTVSHFFCQAAGLVSFYGPAVMAGIPENGLSMFGYTEESMRRALFDAAPMGEMLPNRDGWTARHLPWEDEASFTTQTRPLMPATGPVCLQGNGRVSGRLIGGCVEVMEMIKGTAIWPAPESWDETILFLETSEDAPSPDFLTYWLRNYAATGILQRVSGILLGRPGGADLPVDKHAAYGTAVVSVLQEYGLDHVAVLANMDFGHTDPMMVLPMGVMAEINCNTASLTVTEAATYPRCATPTPAP